MSAVTRNGNECFAFCPAASGLQAAKDIAETMAKSRNVVYLPNSGNMLLGINPN